MECGEIRQSRQQLSLSETADGGVSEVVIGRGGHLHDRAIVLPNIQRTVVSFERGHDEGSSRARPGVMVVSVMCDNNWMMKDNCSLAGLSGAKPSTPAQPVAWSLQLGHPRLNGPGQASRRSSFRAVTAVKAAVARIDDLLVAARPCRAGQGSGGRWRPEK